MTIANYLKPIFCFAIMLTLVVILATTAQAKYLTLSEGLDLALANSPSIIAAGQDIKTAKSRAKQAVLAWLPQFNLYLNSSYYKKTPFGENGTGEVEIAPGIRIPAGFLSTSGQEYYDTSMGVSMTQLLLDSGVVSAQIRKAQLNLKLSELEFLEAKGQLSLEVTRKYFRLIELGALILLKEAQVVQAEDLLITASRKNNLEEVGILQVLENEIELEAAKHELSMVVEEKQVTQKEFQRLIGLPLAAELILEEEVEPGLADLDNLEEIVQATEQNNIDIRKARLALELKKSEVSLARSDQKPTATLFGDISSSKTGEELKDSLKDYDQSRLAGLKVSWPIFDSGQTWNKVIAAASDVKKSEMDLENTIGKVALEATNIYNGLLSAMSLLEITQKKKNLAQEKLRLAERFYKREKISRNKLREAEIALAQAVNDELRAKMDYNLNKIKLNVIKGGS
ncbi:TolC family protein [Candidatus Margulisiibacteriota bacterium]